MTVSSFWGQINRALLCDVLGLVFVDGGGFGFLSWWCFFLNGKKREKNQTILLSRLIISVTCVLT